MHFISEELEAYAEKHSQAEPALVAELNRQTHLQTTKPRMVSGHLQGRVLSMIAKLVQPKAILEIGTFTGYATLCMAEGLAADGHIDTLDNNEELYDLQRAFFDKSPWGNQIEQHLGNALDILPTLDRRYDLVFIDADKENYANYFEAIIHKMNAGGLILSDNVLWSGKVLEEVKANDKSTQALLAYNTLLANDPRVETVLLPIRDGLTLSRVK